MIDQKLERKLFEAKFPKAHWVEWDEKLNRYHCRFVADPEANTYNAMFKAWLTAKSLEVIYSHLINEIQSWIAVQSTQAMELDGEEFVVGANELAEFIDQLVKRDSGAEG